MLIWILVGLVVALEICLIILIEPTLEQYLWKLYKKAKKEKKRREINKALKQMSQLTFKAQKEMLEEALKALDS